MKFEYAEFNGGTDLIYLFQTGNIFLGKFGARS